MPWGEAAFGYFQLIENWRGKKCPFLKFKLERRELTPQKVSTNAGAPGHQAGFSTGLKPLSSPPSLEIPK